MVVATIQTMLHNTHRLIEIDRTFLPRIRRRGHAKWRDNMSFIIIVREMALFQGQPIHSH